MSAFGMSTTVVAPSALNWPSMKDMSVGTEMGYKSIKDKRIDASGGVYNTSGAIKWETIGFTGRVTSTPRYCPEFVFTIGNVGKTGNGAGTVDEMLATVSGRVGLARCGVNSIIQDAEVSLNGCPSIKSRPRRDVNLYMQTCDPDALAVISPASAPDEYCYFDSSRTNNPLKNGGDTVNILDTRGLGGRYYYTIEADATAHTVTLTVEPVEMLAVSPFQWRNPDEATPFPSLEKFEMTLSVSDVVKELLCVDDTIGRSTAGDPLTVDLTSVRHSIFMESYEESDLIEPPTGGILYNCPEVKTLRTIRQPATTAAGTTAEFTVPDLRIMGGVPTRILGVCEHPNTEAWGVPKRSAVLQSVTMDVNNTRGIYNKKSIIQLYEDNVKCGYNGSFATFTGLDASVGAGNPGAGGLFVCDLAKLPLGSFVIPNMSDDVTISGTWTWKNQLGSASNIEFELLQLYDNFLVYNDGKYEMFRPQLSHADVVKAKVAFETDTAARNSVRGGSWYGDMWNSFRRFINSKAARQAVKSVRNLPGVKDFVGDRTMMGHMAKSVGYGKKGGNVQKVGGKKKGGSLKRATGGARATGEDLDSMFYS